jgi:hypothetical protein
MPEPKLSCIACGRTSDQVPLIRMLYQDQEYAICPQHLPILIHKPQQLADKLPGAKNLEPHEHE